jgi:hypothetical protein
MAVNVVNSAISSRRFNRWAMVVGAVVLVAGVIAIVVTQFGNTAKTENTSPTGPPIAAAPKAQQNIPFPKAAWRVANEFLFTALPRKHLAESYAISHPDMRAGFTLKQWESGNIPVTYFPTAKVYRYNWKNTNYAHPRDVQQNVILVPKNGSGEKAIYAQIGVTKIGRGSQAHWAVSYFSPLAGPPVPTNK